MARVAGRAVLPALAGALGIWIFYLCTPGTLRADMAPGCAACDPNADAAISGLLAVQGRISWTVDHEFDIVGYLVETSITSRDGPWLEAGSRIDANGSGRYESQCNLPVGGFVRIRQINRYGRMGTLGVTITLSEAPVLPERPNYSDEFLRARAAGLLARNIAGSDTTQLSGRSVNEVVVYSRAEHFPDLEDYYVPYLESAGYVVILESVNSLPADDSQFRSAVKASIAAYHSDGVEYFHFIGDANDNDEFDGALTAEYWPSGFWENVRQGKLSNGYPSGGEPDKDIIPTYYVKDTEIGQYNQTRGWPYYATDLPYADVVADDNVPDVALARWPISGPFFGRTKLLSMLVRFLEYNGLRTPAAAPLRSNIYSWNQEKPEYDSSEFEKAFAESLQASLNGHLVLSKDPGISTIEEHTNRCRIAWNERRAHFHIISGTGSSRYAPGNTFSKLDFHAFSLNANLIGVVLAGTCYTANFAMTQKYSLGGELHSEPPCEDFLNEAGLVDGAVVWIGPTCATWETRNRGIMPLIAQRLIEAPLRPMAKSFQIAISDCESAPGNLWPTSRSYVFLGDPVSRMQRDDVQATHVSVGAADELRDLDLRVVGQMPTSGPVGFQIETARSIRLSVRVFDVRGALVRSVSEGVMSSVGRATLTWDARNQSGQFASPGVYFVEVAGGGMRRFARVVIGK